MYNEALIELNDALDMEKVSVELNRSIKFGFVFKDSTSMIILKPMIAGIKEMKNSNSSHNPTSNMTRSFTKMDIKLPKKKST